jgi:uncharacterized protein
VKATKLNDESSIVQLTQEFVRTAMLAAQGLLAPLAAPATKEMILPTIRQMGYLQIDTIQAVRRSQNLVLWSRLGDIDPVWLDQVHADGQLFEYYAHALCYLPIEDYPIFRGLILYDARVGKGRPDWVADHPEVIEHVRSVIEKRGAVCSSDFQSQTISTGWGDVKREKLALSHMFSTGELMVPFRIKFRRYYDFQTRVLPGWDDADAYPQKTACEKLILKSIHALGVACEDWIATYYYLLKSGMPEVLSELLAEGQIHQVQVNGWEAPAFIHNDQVKMVEAVARGELLPSHTTLLSPFDPLISDRDRVRELFDFDYVMESYTPAKDRQYGYFCLPILHKGRLIGRLDPKAHRQQKQMEIKRLYLETGVKIDDELVEALKDTLSRFTTWHEMTSLQITSTEPPELREALT